MNPNFTLTETADGSLTVFDPRVGENYKSRHAAFREAEKVFIEPGVTKNPLRLSANPFRVLELGLGLATNLRALARAQSEASSPPVTEYVGIDRDTLGLEFLFNHDRELHSAWVNDLVHGKPASPAPGLYARFLRGEFGDELGRLRAAGEVFHAVFFDPFSPKANPEAWTPANFRLAYSLLAPGGRLVTYSVSRVTKDGLRDAGFEFAKYPLPAILNKREGIVATKPFAEPEVAPDA